MGRVTLFSLLCLLLLGASYAQQANVHLRFGIDDWISESPFMFGDTAAKAATNYTDADIAPIKQRAVALLKEAFGIDVSAYAPYGDGMSGDGRYTVVPIGVGQPYRMQAYAGAISGQLNGKFSSSKVQSVKLYELTLNNNPQLIPAGANYTGLYKGPIRAGDILAAGLYRLTLAPSASAANPTVLDFYMVSAIPGITVGGITNENFRIYSREFGSGIAEIQIISGNEIDASGKFHVFIQNNFYFPAPTGITAIPPLVVA